MTPLEASIIGATVGATAVALLILAYWIMRDQWQRYTDQRLREVKTDLRREIREATDE